MNLYILISIIVGIIVTLLVVNHIMNKNVIGKKHRYIFVHNTGNDENVTIDAFSDEILTDDKLDSLQRKIALELKLEISDIGVLYVGHMTDEQYDEYRSTI